MRTLRTALKARIKRWQESRIDDDFLLQEILSTRRTEPLISFRRKETV